MPPAKRSKKSTSSSSQLHLQPQPKAAVRHEKGEEEEEKQKKKESQQSKNVTTTTTTTLLSPPADTVEHIDPSLLEEEEGLSDLDASTGKPTATADIATTTTPSHRTGDGRGGGGYNSLKQFKGQIYSGMAVGGSHTWEYQPGTWHETKEEPDLWKIDYRATKRRAGRRRLAPKGSGAPVGTEYHWYIVAHQYVRKMDANTYETHMTGSKYKLAHKGAEARSWSVPSVKGQREREIELLEDAGRRVRGLPPVLAGEKVRVEKREKGQQRLDVLFGAGKAESEKEEEEKSQAYEGVKRKREGNDDYDDDEGAAKVVEGDISEEG
ncbi:hypothetical protein AJ78_00083 [Emergomyces pasteurianus Ep9510]|uniref:Uncharacterized protein n=1 Tax=Emergomyces pasteurianus Ep9510 TaxID=1447872 RepID=A0A1J9PVY8_9EURO|nr:hypothetical protein AJ78_00083 [Emergomyces pasteurianus Ep9510]